MGEDIRASIREVQRFFDSLALSLNIGDDVAAVVAARRLRAALRSARADATAIADQVMLHDIANAAQPLLDDVPARVEGIDTFRLARWLGATQAMTAHDGLGPDQFELDAMNRELSGTIWRDLRVLCANLAASSLYRAEFDGVHLAWSDLTRVNAMRSSWTRARVIETRLAGAMLTDAVVQQASFEDCDLRGAHFGTELGGPRAIVSRTRFVRCDLRDTTWSQRAIVGVALIECKVFGIRGASTLEAIEIARADVSSADGRTDYAAPDEVLAAWRS